MRLDPFGMLFESKKYPHARTLRTSLWKKIKDAYTVLSGKIDRNPNNEAVGIFDYLTLGIPFFFRWFLSLCLKFEPSHRYKLILFISLLCVGAWIAILFIPSFLDLLVRNIFAVSVVIATLPLIAIIHGISRLASRKLWQSLDTINMIVEEQHKTSVIQTFAQIQARFGAAKNLGYKDGHFSASFSDSQLQYNPVSYGSLTEPQEQAIFALNLGNARIQPAAGAAAPVDAAPAADDDDDFDIAGLRLN